MNSFLRRTVPAALLAGGALMVATAGAAGAQVPVPGADGLPTGGVDSLSGAPAALCSGPLGAISGLGGVCDVAKDDQVQMGDGVLPASDQSADEATDQSQVERQNAVDIDLEGDEEPEPEFPVDEPCDVCTATSETTVPTTPSSETTVTTVATSAPPTTQVAAVPPAEELPRTGSTVAPFAVAGAALLAVGAALVATKRFALGRR